MSLLAWPALLLLLAVPVLVLLALRSPRPRVIAVGSLLLWQRVRAVTPPPTTKHRKLEPLLWLLPAAALAGALVWARPTDSGASTAARTGGRIHRGAGRREPRPGRAARPC